MVHVNSYKTSEKVHFSLFFSLYLPSRVLSSVHCWSWSPWRRCVTPADSPAVWRGALMSCVCTFPDLKLDPLHQSLILQEHLAGRKRDLTTLDPTASYHAGEEILFSCRGYRWSQIKVGISEKVRLYNQLWKSNCLLHFFSLKYDIVNIWSQRSCWDPPVLQPCSQHPPSCWLLGRRQYYL